MQNISPIDRFILEIQILESPNLKDHAHFLSTPSPKVIKVTFGFPEFLSKHQKPIYSINSFLSYSQFQCPQTRVATLTNLYQQFVSSLCSGDIVNLKILQFEWSRVFWPISQVQDQCKNTANNMNFLYRPNSEKNNDKIFK